MSGSLKRAFGLWVTSQAPGLHVYANHLANAKHSYPCCTVTELRYSLSRFGCGQRDYTVRAPDTDFVTASGKMLHADTTYRLTISAPSDEQHPGSEIVDEFLDLLTDAVMRTGLDREPLVLLDTIEMIPASHVPGISSQGRAVIPCVWLTFTWGCGCICHIVKIVQEWPHYNHGKLLRHSD